MTLDETFMTRALRLAERGRGFVSPNPLVGACLARGSKLISEGFHRRFGTSHAEVEAIRKAGRRTSGSTLYVTLEPCSTWGKTPPCTSAILAARIKRVVIGALDPNPKHSGRGVRWLRHKGLSVETGVCAEEALGQNEAFGKWIRLQMPFVVLKLAQSLDGKIASRTGESKWITGRIARRWVHDLRAASDGILVGKNTVLRDNPRLTVRNGRLRRQPWRIILDTTGEVSPRAKVFQEAGPALLVCSTRSFKRVVRKFAKSRATILAVREKKGRIDLVELLRRIGKLGIVSLLVEGGGEVAWSFLEARLVDKVCWVVAPKIIGGRHATTSVEGLGVASMAESLEVQRIQTRQLGQDYLLEGYLN